MKPTNHGAHRPPNTSTISRNDVIALLGEQKKRYEENLSSLRQEIMSAMDVKLREVIDSLQFSQNELVQAKQDLSRVTKDYASLRTQFSDISNDSRKLQLDVEQANERADYMEDQSRRNNLRISGIPEDSNENWEQSQRKIDKLLREKFNLTPDLERAHRVGKGRKTPRDIVAKFTRYQDRDAVFKNRRTLAGTNIYINEDLCPATMQVRHNQMDNLRKARSEGKVAFFSYRKLVIRERRPGERPVGQPGRAGSPRSPPLSPRQTTPHTAPAASSLLQFPVFPPHAPLGASLPVQDLGAVALLSSPLNAANASPAATTTSMSGHTPPAAAGISDTSDTLAANDQPATHATNQATASTSYDAEQSSPTKMNLRSNNK